MWCARSSRASSVLKRATLRRRRNRRVSLARVSVIIPTYNYGAYITDAIESLRAQTYESWECVVVDDGSTDDTAEVVARFVERDPRVRYLRQENQRQSVAKNTGLAATAGEYIQFLDSDDRIEPLKFERQVEFLETHP